MRSPEIGTYNSRPELGEALDDQRISMTRGEIAAYLRSLYASDPEGFDLDQVCQDLESRLDDESVATVYDVAYQFMVYLAGNCTFEEIA